MKFLVALFVLILSVNVLANDWGDWATLPSMSDTNNTLDDKLPPSLVEALADPEALRTWVLDNPEWAQRWAESIDLDLAPIIGQDAWDIVLNNTLEQLNQQDNVIQPIQPPAGQPPVTIIPPKGSN
ncbi:hypothetical protein [Salinibius halmophilus]|uniref:hypothetical protein n=1 Tax=Salinibius halmophilus TaxID=1853216 RepID=UPI000E671A19|nr:hypothetical protein [Salinibius halmophilus]